MTTRTIAIYATNTMADWEFAYLTPQITLAEQLKPGRFQLVFVGEDLSPVTTLGGLSITPTMILEQILTDEDLAILVIPGGNTYGSGHEKLETAAKDLINRNIPVAAICGATYFLARIGLLNDRDHTSNAQQFLASTGYTGSNRYQEEPAVTDRGIITASGLNAVPFTAAIMREIELLPDSVVNAWESLNVTKEAQYFFALEAALEDFATS